MKISVLGTGMVGQTLATKLASLGHEVMIGSRDKKNPKASEWIKKLPKTSLGTFAESAGFGEIILNCTLGSAALAALKLAGEQNLGSKIVIDTTNPLNFSKNNEPSLFVCNTESLAEQIQDAFPKIKLVKALNTVTIQLMVNPGLLPGTHNLFIAGNDSNAKKSVRAFLNTNFGWHEDAFIDLGDLSGARASEMIIMMWIRLWQHFQNPVFNYHVITPENPFKAPDA